MLDGQQEWQEQTIVVDTDVLHTSPDSRALTSSRFADTAKSLPFRPGFVQSRSVQI